MGRIDIWLPGTERVRSVLERLTAPESPLTLPLESWPAVVDYDSNGHAHFSGDHLGWPDITGSRPENRIFNDDGWTHELFEQFVLPHRHMRADFGDRTAPALTALAGYARVPILVCETFGDQRILTFVHRWGDVNVADYEGDDEGLERIRSRFFHINFRSAREDPRVTLRRVAPESIVGPAMLRRAEIQDWKIQHVRGRLAAPTGATLTAENLELVHRDDFNELAPVIAHAHTEKHRYEILFPLEELEPLEVLCAVDGVLQSYVDAAGVNRGLGAHAPEWAQWILRDSIDPGAATVAGVPLWHGEGPEAQLYRLANNIVNYEDHETGTSLFTTALEMEAWLKKKLGNHNAPLTVRLLDDISLVLATEKPLMFQQHEFHRPDGPQTRVGYYANAFLPWRGVENWATEAHGKYGRHPEISTIMDGDTVESMAASNCLDFADLEQYLLADSAPVEPNSWFLIQLDGTRTCIAFPAQDSMLQVTTDNDGASASITAREYFSRGDELRREYDFETRWDRWLNDDRALSKEEIAHGLKTLKRLTEDGNK